MNRKSLVKSTLKLLVLCIVFGVLLISPSRGKVATTDSCDTQFGFCIYANCMGLQGSDYLTCRNACDHNYDQCMLDGYPSDPLPAPYPVIDFSRSNCLAACLECQTLEIPSDSLECYMVCWNYCNETYPKN